MIQTVTGPPCFILREADSITGEERQNTFDVENRLSQAVIKKGGVVSVDQRNEYNGEGQRIRKRDNEKVTDYFYEGATVLYTANDTGDKTGIHYMGLTGNIIAAQKKNEEGEFAAYLYNKNVQGNTTGLIAADGTNALSYRYDDFGNTEVLGDTAVENEICYTGGIYDAATGEYYLNARYYDPEDGRFVTQDTYRGESNSPSTLHLYSYCTNNPINYMDPSGHWVVAVGREYSASFILAGSVLFQIAVDGKGYFNVSVTGSIGFKIEKPQRGKALLLSCYPTLKSVKNLKGHSFSIGATLKVAWFSFSGSVFVNPGDKKKNGLVGISGSVGASKKITGKEFSVHAMYSYTKATSAYKISKLLKAKKKKRTTKIASKKVTIKRHKKKYLSVSVGKLKARVYKNKKIRLK